MPCFCKTSAAKLPTVTPTASLSVMAVPPQMQQLLSLLGLEAAGSARADLKLAAMLPGMSGDAWMKATLAATAPHIQLPAILPSGGGGMMSMMMRLAVVAPMFPLTDVRRLVAEIQQAVTSLMAQVMPQAQALRGIPGPQLQNMALAARMTLALRAQGIYPMALANLDFSFAAQAGVASPQSRMTAALAFAARLPKITVAPFALPLPKVNLALTMAALAPMATAPQAMGLPPAPDPNLARMLMNQLAALSTVPMPPLPLPVDELLALAAKLEDLETIKLAFGEDALTPAGVARVNAMLRFMAQLRIPIPLPAVALQAKIDALPKIDDIKLGAQAAKGAGMNLAASMTAQVPPVPILPLLEALAALSGVLQKALKVPPLGPCDACNFDIGAIQDSLSNMQLPPPPPLPPLPSF